MPFVSISYRIIVSNSLIICNIHNDLLHEYIYMYVYIYICVGVCMYMCPNYCIMQINDFNNPWHTAAYSKFHWVSVI